MSWSNLLKRIRREQRKRFQVTDYDSELNKKIGEMSKKMKEIESELFSLSEKKKNATTFQESQEISKKIEETAKKLKEIRKKMGKIEATRIIRRRGSRDFR
tara:strand:- start:100 stop:402 length:303 start_codon:yes stop_codon:yes gene_type:complete